MKTLVKPTVQELETLKIEATQNGSIPNKDWIAKISISFQNLLRKDPKQYRSYGPFWWLLKKELIGLGIKDFGDHIDLEWLEMTDYGDSMLNILASWTYGDYASEQGLLYSNVHSITFTHELTDSFSDERRGASAGEYTLIDEEMEVMVWSS